MGNSDEKYIAQVLREFTIFFAVMFFTCVVGIIEFLPELDKIHLVHAPWGFTTISIIYFALLAGIIYSVKMCFGLYERIREFMEKGISGFVFPFIEPFETKGKMIKKFLMVAILVVFTLLYLVKIGILT